ncbi:helix-turn-helix transcriptional regulator [Microvirga sp. CF3062]|uniref:helix-turn-helix transcriptional regulator n=1 Tax=Microvirga sp. CF3062 TaxID=3110182 RepID=UPI002E793FEE|nr:helix-turn-helix transcriptional regulator [Microvirga sp. CF3062]MEE1658423.1 helix-turn-helix transcriptional regulator [Microvirga sp. CF3062]
MPTPFQLVELIEAIYQASTDSEAWNTVGTRLAEQFQSTASLFIHDATSQSVIVDMSSGFEEEYVSSYKQHFVSINPLIPETLALPDGTVARMFEAVSKRELERTEYFNDWLRPQRLKYSVGTSLGLGDNMSMFVAFHRFNGDRDYSDSEVRAFAQLVPHFRRALHINDRLGAQHNLVAAQFKGLDQMGVGILLLNRDGTLDDANIEGEHLLKTHRLLSTRFGRISIGNPDKDNELKRVLKKAIDQRVAQTISIGSSGEEDLNGTIVPVSGSGSWQAPGQVKALLLFNRQRTSTRRSSQYLQDVYRLTGAETRLLEAISAGQTLNEYCQSHQLSRNTVKTQLKCLFEKTQVSRQADLIRIVWGADRPSA